MEDSSAQKFEKHNVSNSAEVRTKAVEVVTFMNVIFLRQMKHVQNA